MKEDIKAIWLAALESGEYQQGERALHDKIENTFCCLGVLCDLAVKGGIIKEPTYAGTDYAEYGVEKNVSTLPIEVIEWSGVKIPNPYVAGNSRSLASLNDDGSSFSDIARYIEAEL